MPLPLPLPWLQVATDVGFYYMANAAGRLAGTLVSGALYSHVSANTAVGFAACMFASSAFCLLSALIVFRCNDDQDGLRCGPCCAGNKGVGHDSIATDSMIAGMT